MLIDYQKANIYQTDEVILQNVDFHVDEEQFVYVIGKVGSGKSSLLKSIYCEVDFDKADAEKAEVLERNLLTLKRKDIPALRREMGIIFQDFQLLHDRSVKQNLQFVLKATGWKSQKEIDERILKVLEAVGMQDKSNRLPHELSGGEQQRIAIARLAKPTQDNYSRRANRQSRPRYSREDCGLALRDKPFGHFGGYINTQPWHD